MIHRVFRPKKPGDVLSHAYLYGDGHVKAVFERRVREAFSPIRYVKMAEAVGLRPEFEGRIVFHDPAMLVSWTLLPPAGRQGVSVGVQAPSVSQGSDNTKALGLVIGGVTVRSGAGTFHIADLPRLLSSGMSFQIGREHVEAFDPELREYCDMLVVEVIDRARKIVRAA